MDTPQLTAIANKAIKRNKALLLNGSKKQKSSLSASVIKKGRNFGQERRELFENKGHEFDIVASSISHNDNTFDCNLEHLVGLKRKEDEISVRRLIATGKRTLLMQDQLQSYGQQTTSFEFQDAEMTRRSRRQYNFVTLQPRKEPESNHDLNTMIRMTVDDIQQHDGIIHLGNRAKTGANIVTNLLSTNCMNKGDSNAVKLLPECNEHISRSFHLEEHIVGDSYQLEGDNVELQSVDIEGRGQEGAQQMMDVDQVRIPEQFGQMNSSQQRMCFASQSDEDSIRERRQLNDLGSPHFTCEQCSASFWYSERTGKGKRSTNPKYHRCCKKGKVKLPPMPPLPDVLEQLLDYNGDELSKNYRQNIRLCNSMCCFTSFGAKVDTSINLTRGPFAFRISGENNHLLGSLLPEDGKRPKFAQLYVYDTEHEIDNRFAALNIDPTHSPIDRRIIEMLIEMLNNNNRLAKTFRMARDVYEREKPVDLKLRLLSRRKEDTAQYGNVEAPDLAGLIVGSEEEVVNGRDVIVQYKSGLLQRIDSSFPTYMALQYPLMFPYGEDGYSDGLFQVSNRKTARRITKCQYYCYRLHMRMTEAMTLLISGRLTQQFAVDCFTAVEGERLNYYRTHQDELRCELYCGVKDAVVKGNTDGRHLGKRIILPSSFTGGPRYMAQNYQDAMAICRAYGNPDLFLTFTCNTKWKEIEEALKQVPGQKAEDRPDLAARVFKMKVEELMSYLNKKNFFGRMLAALYTIEFQKRGLPHAHILIWLHENDKYLSAADIDKIISAQIQDRNVDPQAYEIFCQFMFQGPCGEARPNSPCMVDGKCSRHFPKKFNKETTVDEEGFPVYKRPDNGVFVMKNGVKLDNRYVVPHNLDLVVKFNAHINVEWCNKARSVKYLFKYINKGPDRVRVFIQYNSNGDAATNPGFTDRDDEIKTFVDCRYLSAIEACWRLFEFPIHYRDPAVERLPFHQEDQQPITFADTDKLKNVLAKANNNLSKFMGWMKTNEQCPEARSLTYAEFPTYYVWCKDKKIWKKRKRGKVIGRIYYAHPSTGEIFYLRMLLNVKKGCTSFQDLRTVGDYIYPTNQQACYALGLLGDDKEWSEAITDVDFWATASQLRDLFVTMLLFCEVGNPRKLWEENWRSLSNDIIYQQRLLLNMPDLLLPESHIKNLALFEIEKLLNKNCSSLEEFDMPLPSMDMMRDLKHRLIYEEISYDTNQQGELYEELYASLNAEQLAAYDKIMHSVNKKEGKVFFVYGQGGTGKTHLWKALLSGMRAEGRIVLPVASSGIAALLLQGGRTAHSRFKIPIEIHDKSACNVSQQSQLAALLRRTELIIWDEAPMDHKFCFEALSRTLQDILGDKSRAFGGMTIVFGGDFRQLLPVIVKGRRDEIVDSSINRSPLWEHCEVIKLTKNMRLNDENLTTAEKEEMMEFANWILHIGNGTATAITFGQEDEPSWVKIPEDLLIPESENNLERILDEIYENFDENMDNRQYLKDRVVIAPTNEVVDKLNLAMLQKMKGDERSYLSFDSVCRTNTDCHDGELLYPPEYLNSLDFNGIPPHELKLKVGAPIILLRNLNQSAGLCNGTRLIVRHMTPRVIQAEILTGSKAGNLCFIPRVTLQPTDSKLPVIFKRRQFPVKLAFAMTINKCQGQTLAKVGLFLPKPVFTHGQLYVAVSRVQSRKGLKILINTENESTKGYTRNIVYKEVFEPIEAALINGPSSSTTLSCLNEEDIGESTA